MERRGKIALLVGQPEEKNQNLIITGFLKQAFSDDLDVCIFAMYQKQQNTKVREQGESDIFSLADPDLFDAIVVMADSIRSQNVLDRIEKNLKVLFSKPVIFVDKKSSYFHTISKGDILYLDEKELESGSCDGELIRFGRYVIKCVESYIGGKRLPDYSVMPDYRDVSEAETGRESAGTDIFDFNESNLEDDMLMQTGFEGLMNAILFHVSEIRPFENFHICLNTDWLKTERSAQDGGRCRYSEKLRRVLVCTGQDGRIDLTEEFDRKELLPQLSEEGGRPRACFFSPLFFADHCFGYAVIDYGQEARVYDASYKRWLCSVMRGLEHHRQICLSQETQTVKKSIPKKLKVLKEQRELRHKQITSTKMEQQKMDVVRDILDNNRFTYFFQPIVKADTGKIFAYEALMRSATEKQVSPLDILVCAENLGRLKDVERATLANVLHYIEEHEDLFEGKRVFLNSIPGSQLPQKEAEEIREKMKKYANTVVVEFTEQTELSDAELSDLKSKFEELGVKTAVDDYGTGYSNVYNLLRYMPDFVKIDRMLLKDIPLSAQKQHFVKEIIEFAHNNQVMVIAEGVETPDELKMVIELGADLIQGFYTARPNAQVLPKIDEKIRNEILQYTQSALKKSMSRVYQAGRDSSVSLVKLASGHFSKIEFAEEEASLREISIVGQQGFQANMEIEICDHYKGLIELTDIDLAVHNERPAIKIGEHCDVTLVLNGENILEQGGILVPETSRLTIRGKGNLYFKQIAVNGYGIGNDKDGRHGELNFEQDGLIEVKGNAVQAVGIGAGYGGKINILRGMYAFNLVGIEAVGIGSLFSDVDLFVQNCALEFTMKTATSVGVGSIKGNVNLAFSHVGLNAVFNTNRCVCLGSLEGKEFKFNLSQAALEFDARSDEMSVIGSLEGEAELSINKFSIKISAEGTRAVALGNLTRTAKVLVKNGDLIVKINNKNGYDIGAETLDIVKGYNEFILNNEKIEREGREEE